MRGQSRKLITRHIPLQSWREQILKILGALGRATFASSITLWTQKSIEEFVCALDIDLKQTDTSMCKN